MEQQSERITHSPENPDAWVCLCGNTPSDEGFYPCDGHGIDVEPVQGWEGLYRCDRCGRIIQRDTLEVVGRHMFEEKPLAALDRPATAFVRELAACTGMSEGSALDLIIETYRKAHGFDPPF